MKILALMTAFMFVGIVTSMTAQEDNLYRELHRPRFHFSPSTAWMNDPNGLVYYEGEYHLFYQHHPNDVVWGPMHWGHAVSADLFHWEHLPIALYPDELGAIWSGSVVVDTQNSSGLVPGGGLVALYSYDNQTQGAAYSTDRGRTWQIYENNPILPALESDFRDPKVLWHEPSQKWVMVIAAKRVIKFFTSDDLLHWDFASDFADLNFYGGVWEVPDLFPMTLDGQEKWVLIVSINPGGPAGGSATRYYIGDFDGRMFTDNYPHNLTWLDYGPDNYAGTTWSAAPDGRRLFIGWMNNWMYANEIPTSPWRGAATLVREFGLRQTSEGIRLVQEPIEELRQLRSPIGNWPTQIIEGNKQFPGLRGQQLEIVAEFELGSVVRFGFDVFMNDANSTRVLFNADTNQLFVVRPASSLRGYETVASAPLLPEDNRIRLHIFVDQSSIEVFGGDGLVSITGQVFPDAGSEGVQAFAEDGSVTLVSLEAYALKTIWAETRTRTE